MNDEFSLVGTRPRSRFYKALRIAFNAFAIAILLVGVGVCMRDLVHSQIWYERFLFAGKMMGMIGAGRIVIALVAMSFSWLLRKIRKGRRR